MNVDPEGKWTASLFVKNMLKLTNPFKGGWGPVAKMVGRLVL